MKPGENAYRLAAMGDIMLDRTVGDKILASGDAIKLGDLRRSMASCDLVFANLETPVAVSGVPDAVQDPNVTFRSHPDTLAVLQKLGIGIVSLGNNHMLDYGPRALHETLEFLDAAGIHHVGAGRNYQEANAPRLLTVNNTKVAFLSHVFIYSASTRMATRNRAGVSDHRIGKILPVIRELRRNGHHVIVSLHWGIEYSFYPLPYQMRQARRMIDCGASLILGHGPHYPQGIERYKDGEIVYSLGNCFFDEPHYFANRSFIYQAGIGRDGQLAEHSLHPFHIIDGIPVLVQGRPKDALLRLISQLDRIYKHKDAAFWKKINNLYFGTIWARSLTTRSAKYALLPPIEFYRQVGIANYLQKLKPSRIYGIFRNMVGWA